MPILATEPSIYPAQLLEETALEISDRRWWAVSTKARQEKSLARELVRWGVPFYLPLVAKENLIRGRRVLSQIPLFGGYLFLYGNEAERSQSLTTHRVACLLEVADGEELACDLRYVRQLIESDAPLTVERRLMPGQRVRIKAGSMMGTEGTVISHRGKTKLVVAVSFLQQGVSMEIDNFLLEPID